MAQVTIRPATVDDLTEVARIHVASWQAAYRGQLPDAYLDGLSSSEREAGWRSRVQNAAPRQELWVMERDAEVLGVAALGPSRDADAEEGWGEIYAIYLRPDCWGQGVGRELLVQASRRLTNLGFKRSFLWVLESNERARRFYERAGWRATVTTRVEQGPEFEFREVRYERDTLSLSSPRVAPAP